MLTWILVAAGLFGGYWLFLRPATPIFYRGQHQSDAPKFVQSMFMFLRPGAVAHFEHESTRLRFRLRTLRLSNNELGIRIELPNAANTSPLEAAVRTRLEAGGFACLPAQVLDRLWPAQDPPLFVSNELQHTEAVRAVEAVGEGLGLGRDARYTIHMEGIPSFSAHKEYLRKRNPSAS